MKREPQKCLWEILGAALAGQSGSQRWAVQGSELLGHSCDEAQGGMGGHQDSLHDVAQGWGCKDP